ncbi:hypothetical protein KBD33_05335 [Candidatus Gracilibacteria bacterium]|nr:hypothetical protein [Candidatus Gracilibacteria bacterium]
MLGSLAHYDYGKDCFDISDSPKDVSYRDVLLKEIEEKLSQDMCGVTISVLSEIPRTLGMGYNSVFPLCLGAMIMILKDSACINDLTTLPNKHIQDSINNNLIFNQLLHISLELDPIIHGKMTAAMKISSFFDGRHPIVGFRDRGEYTIASEHLDSVKVCGARIDEMYDNIKNTEFPFDFGVVVSDKPILRENFKNVNHMSNVSPLDKAMLKESIDTIMDYKEGSDQLLPKFYNFLRGDNDLIYDTYGVMMGAISIETVNIFGKILSSHYSDELFATFFFTINKIRYGNNIIRRISPYFSGFIDSFLSIINLPSYEFACFPNNTLVREGTLTYVSYSEKNRSIISAGVEKIKNQYPGSYVLYSSTVDGITDKGFIIEQHIDQGIISKHLNNNSWELRDDVGIKLVGDFEYLIRKNEYDLILDVFNGKIYHKGEKLTSQDLSSQSTTIELIALLFSKSNREITNKDMSYSSYSKNKNELSNKIIVPLEKWVKEKISKDCIIKATGSLTDYTIYIKYNTLKIGFLDKKRN